MPPIRNISMAAATKPVKTERSHEENQERYAKASFRFQVIADVSLSEHTLPHHGAVTAASKLVLSPLDEHQRYTSGAQVARCV